jgi:hypothetical protein
MSSTVPTVPSKKPATKPADDANNAPATDPAVTNPRNDFDALAGTSGANNTENDDDKDDDGATSTPAVKRPRSTVVATSAADDDDDEGDDDALDPNMPDDLPVPASRRTHNDATDGLSAGSALMRATSAAGSVNCPKCGAVWPLQNRFAGGVIPCVCGKNIEVGSPN